MKKCLSVVWPWDHGRFDQGDVVHLAQVLGVDEVCLRTPVYTESYNLAWYTELARQLKLVNIDVSLWPVVAFRYPVQEVAAIVVDCTAYKPVRLFLDAESKRYMNGLPLFLKELANAKFAGAISCPIGLGSYRRANYHREMDWSRWYRAVDSQGDYVIDFLAHQLYPIGWTTPNAWTRQFRMDIDSHEIEIKNVGRPDMPWYPWMPAFIGSGFEGVEHWVPRAESVKAAVEYMQGRLGSRLHGMNWWSLDEDLVDIPELYEYIKSIPGEGTGPDLPTPPPTVGIDMQVAVDMYAELRDKLGMT